MKRKLLVWLLILIFLFSSCKPLVRMQGEVDHAIPTIPPDVFGDNKPITGDEVIADSFNPILKTIRFTPDLKNSDSVKYEGEEESITVYTENFTWTLILPEGLGIEPQEITMVPLRDTSSDGLIKTFEGVLLEPDGLLMDTPATLTITGGGAEEIIAFYRGQNNGSLMIGEPIESVEDGVSASITHFSSAVAQAPDLNDPELLKQLEAYYKACRKMAENLFKKEIGPVPEPPEISLRCYHEEDEDEASLYTVKYLFEEIYVNTWLSVIDAALVKINDPRATEVNIIRKKINTRAYKKVDNFFEQYGNIPNKQPIANFMSFMVQMFNYSDYDLEKMEQSREITEYFKPRLIDWTYEAILYCVDGIRKDHSYDYIPYIEKMIKIVKDHRREALLSEINAALTFTLDIRGFYSQKDISSSSEWLVEGQSVLDYDGTREFNISLGGGGSINVTSFSEVVDSPRTEVGKLYMTEPEYFNSQARDHDPCKGSFYLQVKKLGKEKILYIYDTGEIVEGFGINAAAQYVFSSYYNKEINFFEFPMEIKPGEGQVEKIFENELTNEFGVHCNAIYEFKLTHTPQ